MFGETLWYGVGALEKSHHADVAQLVERIHGKDEVTSSILVVGSSSKEQFRIAELFFVRNTTGIIEYMRVALQAYKEGFKNSVGVVLMLFVIFGALLLIDQSTLQTWIIQAGGWAPMVFVLAKASTLVFAPLSGGPLYPLAGALFGFNVGFVLLLLGDALGSTIAFALSRVLGRGIVERMVKEDSGMVARVSDVMTTTKGFMLARVCLASLPEVVAYAAGLTRIGFWKFFVMQNAVGVLPTAVFCFAGSTLVLLQSPVALLATSVGGVLAAAIGFALFGWWVRRSTLTH